MEYKILHLLILAFAVVYIQAHHISNRKVSYESSNGSTDPSNVTIPLSDESTQIGENSENVQRFIKSSNFSIITWILKLYKSFFPNSLMELNKFIKPVLCIIEELKKLKSCVVELLLKLKIIIYKEISKMPEMKKKLICKIIMTLDCYLKSFHYILKEVMAKLKCDTVGYGGADGTGTGEAGGVGSDTGGGAEGGAEGGAADGAGADTGGAVGGTGDETSALSSANENSDGMLDNLWSYLE